MGNGSPVCSTYYLDRQFAASALGEFATSSLMFKLATRFTDVQYHWYWSV
jgi:hypothetical protein